MINLKIPTHSDYLIIQEYLKSFNAQGEIVEGNVGMIEYMDYEDWLPTFANSKKERTHLIMLNESMIGTIDFRFNKRSRQRLTLGQIGYAIHPLYRNQGYATKALKIGIQLYPDTKVIVTCLKENIASSKAIQSAGGILQKDFMYDGLPSLRYEFNKEKLTNHFG